MAVDQFTEFDYLLNALESAASCEYPAQHGYGEKRKALYRHVRELERKAALWNLIESMWSFPGQTLGEVVRRIEAERTAGVMGTEAPSLTWCEHCGEGVTDFCRGKLRLCPKGLRVLHRNAGVNPCDGGQR